MYRYVNEQARFVTNLFLYIIKLTWSKIKDAIKIYIEHKSTVHKGYMSCTMYKVVFIIGLINLTIKLNMIRFNNLIMENKFVHAKIIQSHGRQCKDYVIF